MYIIIEARKEKDFLRAKSVITNYSHTILFFMVIKKVKDEIFQWIVNFSNLVSNPNK